MKTDFLVPYLKSWKSAEKALESWIEMNFIDQKLPEEFAKVFCTNYSRR
jgi:hypothetical protein